MTICSWQPTLIVSMYSLYDVSRGRRNAPRVHHESMLHESCALRCLRLRRFQRPNLHCAISREGDGRAAKKAKDAAVFSTFRERWIESRNTKIREHVSPCCLLKQTRNEETYVKRATIYTVDVLMLRQRARCGQEVVPQRAKKTHTVRFGTRTHTHRTRRARDPAQRTADALRPGLDRCRTRC